MAITLAKSAILPGHSPVHLLPPALAGHECLVLIALGSLPDLPLQPGQVTFKALCRQLQYLL